MAVLKYKKEKDYLDGCEIAIIGLGYVGLPLAVELGKNNICQKTKLPLKRSIIGFDINSSRINELLSFHDRTGEISKDKIKEAKNLIFTSEKSRLINSKVFIITVPTPINNDNNPDLSFIKQATIDVSEIIKKNFEFTKNNPYKPLIIYESTVYPGVTEEVCIPIIENITNSKINDNFFCGYSPERINPGDKKNQISNIMKVTSGSNEEAANIVDYLYSSIIKCGTHKASSIKVAEASKVIENTQRDLNIAFVNELSMIFKALNINTKEVLEAASTKWNFLSFQPGLVGGHCIGIDPYYLTYKSRMVGFYPKLVSSGREINDGMPKWIVEQLIVEMAKKQIIIGGTKVLILGYAYKENCPDYRNSRVYNILTELKKYDLEYDLVDPHVDINACKKEFNINIRSDLPKKKFQVLIVAVGHKKFKQMTEKQWLSLITKNSVIFDIKGILPKSIETINL